MTIPDGQGSRSSSSLALAALAARAQLGDRSSLEALLRRLQIPLLDHIRSIVRDDDLAADVLQDTLIIVCRRLSTLRDSIWVRAWAYRVATREAVRAAKRVSQRRAELIEDAVDLADASALPSLQDDEDLLAELPTRLAALPAGAQIVLRMHYLESLTQQEVAEALEIPLGTVKSRIGYGLACLRKGWLRK